MPDVFGLTDAAFAANADVQASKVQHQYLDTYAFPGPVHSIEVMLGRVYGVTGSLVALHAWLDTLPTGLDEVEVDLQSSVGGGAWASVLTAPLSLTAGNTVRLPTAASIAVAALAVGTLLKLVLTVTGSTAANLGVTLVRREKAAPP